MQELLLLDLVFVLALVFAGQVRNRVYTDGARTNAYAPPTYSYIVTVNAETF